MCFPRIQPEGLITNMRKNRLRLSLLKTLKYLEYIFDTFNFWY
jgi:hypothetical protein